MLNTVVTPYEGLSKLVCRYLGEPIHSGKVRTTWRLPEGKRLVVVSDRRSIFDFMLGFDVPGIREILHAFNVANRIFVIDKMLALSAHHGTDVIAYGAAIDMHLPQELHEHAGLRKRALVARDLIMVPVESVVRSALTGSAYVSYIENDRYVCGHELPRGLRNGSMIPNGPIWTPTTKAHTGHDEPLDFREADEAYPGLQEFSLQIFRKLSEFARARGVLVLDKKDEFGTYCEHDDAEGENKLCIADEVGTPDSSRFVSMAAYAKQFMRDGGALPPSRDKELLRSWGKEAGVPQRDPLNQEYRRAVR